MKKHILKLTLSFFAISFGLNSYSQCPTITCPANISVSNDAASCGAVVTYSAPVGNDPCAGNGYQTFIVPSGVTSISIDAYGAEGGTNTNDSVNCRIGGTGGFATGTLAVTPGQTLYVFVGGRGYSGNNGGWNGGGAACTYTATCATGGGASDVRVGGITLNDRVIVAGGGGGAEWSGCSGTAGNGGGLVGIGGAHPTLGGTNGDGGSQTAGGAAGVGSYPATAGTFGIGGTSATYPGSGHAGSGGGGWYGGGGSAPDGHGGGGSSYIGGVTSGSTTAGGKLDNGLVVFNYVGGPTTFTYGSGSVTVTQTAGLASGSTFPVGVTTNTFEVTGGTQTVTCSFTVTVVDVEAPAITCPSNITVNNDVAACGAVVTYTAPVGTDNCSGATTVLTSGLGSGALFPVGTTTETYEVTDAANNTFSCSFTVTVVDVEAPAITCLSNITVNNDAAACGAVVTYTAPVGTDNCSGATTVLTSGLGSGALFPVGTTTETYEVTDAANNTFSCSFTVTVVDAEAPTMICTNITAINDAASCGAVVTYTAPVGTDNCSGATTVLTSGLGSGALFPVGTTTETYEVTDAANNTFSCSFTVTVVDAEIPTVSCPANITSCNPTINGIAPTTADNCTGETVAYNLTGATTGSGVADASGTLFNVGTTAVKYIVTDVAGNKDSCSFDITINPLPAVIIDAFNPDTICESGAAINLPAGTPASGTYSGNGVSGSTFDPAIDGIGSYYVVYTFTDANTCTNSDSTLIVVASCVGINESSALPGISIFPNPTSNIINITLEKVTAPLNINLTSIDGKVVYQLNNITDKSTAIDISKISTGVYFLRIGNEIDFNVYKVIKQ